jgi:hypothetical protein
MELMIYTYRALALQVVSAAVCLALQSQDEGAQEGDSWKDDVNECIDYLEAITSWNALARRGSRMLSNLLVTSAISIETLPFSPQLAASIMQ